VRDIFKNKYERCNEVTRPRIDAERVFQRVIGLEYVLQPILIFLYVPKRSYMSVTPFVLSASLT